MASKNRKNKVKFKLRKELVFLVVGLLAILAVTIILSLPSSNEKLIDEINTAITEYNSKNSTNSSSQLSTLAVDSDHLIFEKVNSYDELLNLKSKDQTYVLYGSLTDSVYLTQLTTAHNLALTHKIDKIYLYFSTDVDNQDDTSATDFVKMMDEREEKLNNGKDSSVEAIDLVENVPALWVFNENKVVFNTQSEETVDWDWNAQYAKAFGLFK